MMIVVVVVGGGGGRNAIDDYDDAIKRAYYSQSDKETKQIIDSAKQRLEEAGLNQFERYVENQRDKKGTQIIY